MTIHETRYLIDAAGHPTTVVMVESIADDVAAYEFRGRVSGHHAAHNGHKLTERQAIRLGLTIPPGKYYRR